MQQGSPEWFEAKRGRCGASKFRAIITAKTGALSTSHKSLVYELIQDTLAPEDDSFTGNVHTQRGIDQEPEARDMFRELTGYTVKEVGFITWRKGAIGCSPDGLVYDGDKLIAGLEIKCPTMAEHAEYHDLDDVPDKYKQQVHGSMAITGLPWYFVSYHRKARPFVKLIEPSDYTAKVLDALEQFETYYMERRRELLAKLR